MSNDTKTEIRTYKFRPLTEKEQIARLNVAIKEQKLKHAQAQRVVEVIRGIFYVAMVVFLALVLVNGTSHNTDQAKCESIGGRWAGDCYYNGQAVDVDEMVKNSSIY